jgi:hypothetical protein
MPVPISIRRINLSIIAPVSRVVPTIVAIAVTIGIWGCGGGSSAKETGVRAEITRCYIGSEGTPAADVQLNVANPEPADPTYVVAVVFRPTDGSGNDAADTYRTSLSPALGITHGTVTVPSLSPGQDNSSVRCSIVSVTHLQNKNGQEVSTEVQGAGAEIPLT